MTTPALLPAMDSARGLTSEIAQTTRGMRPERDGTALEPTAARRLCPEPSSTPDMLVRPIA